MKKIFALLLFTQYLFAQQPYYDDVNISLTGEDLYFELQQKISIHNTAFTYGNARDVLVFTDEFPENTSKVFLIYGYNDTDSNCTTDRTRDKDDFGGGACQYNREHVFARSHAIPDMGDPNNNSTGIVADPHNIRPSDQQMNNNKGNKKLQDGSGHAGNVGSGNWYPGDEWKGDVARMVMYMYTRYGDQCLPSYTGVGNLQGSTQMLQTFLQWNADDPVTQVEDQRNDYLEENYLNRNPFIDNPYLATVIWGGPMAEDRWGIASINEVISSTFTVFPQPASDFFEIYSNSTIDAVVVYDISGKIILNIPNPENRINVQSLSKGTYLIKILSGQHTSIKKLVVRK